MKLSLGSPCIRTLIALSAFGAFGPFEMMTCLLWQVSEARGMPEIISGANLRSNGEARVELKAVPKAAVIVFLSARCPCSSSHEKTLSELAAEFGPKGFVFVGVHSNADEGEAEARRHFEGAPISFPVIQDTRAKLADALGAIKTPHVFVVAPSGEVLFQGGADDTHLASHAKEHYLRTALSTVAAGKHPDPERVRTIGCAIKRP